MRLNKATITAVAALSLAALVLVLVVSTGRSEQPRSETRTDAPVEQPQRSHEMSENKTTLVVTAVPNPSEMASVQEYLGGVMPLFQAAGGELVKRLKVEKSLHGKLS